MSDVQRHYERPDLEAAILAALRQAGKNPEALTPEDLAPFDQFHIRGRQATVELAELAGIAKGTRVLDVGCGIGGPARTLAAAFGADVSGIDLTESYCRAATMLTERVGLADRVRFRQADALALPFADGAFDLVWTQHAAMNIADKRRLYGEIARVLRPGGRFALYDVMAGPTPGGPHFPVPWASRAELSFLIAPASLRDLLAELGFRERAWRPMTAPAIAWFRELRARRLAAEGPPAPGLHLIIGPDFPVMADNVLRSLEEGRIEVAQGVLERP